MREMVVGSMGVLLTIGNPQPPMLNEEIPLFLRQEVVFWHCPRG